MMDFYERIQHRFNILKYLKKFKRFNAYTYTEQTIIADNLERKIFRDCVNNFRAKNKVISMNHNSEFFQLYCSKIYLVISHINMESDSKDKSDSKNHEILDFILDRKYVNYDLSEITARVLLPSYTMDIQNNIDLRLRQKIETKVCRLYICPKCKKNETQTQTIQLRREDEGSNVRITCMNCNHIWII